MFKRAHHQRVERLLNAFDAEILTETKCFFGGGTAISLMLGEYRESIDVDFLCASAEGYRRLRNIVRQDSLGTLLKEPIRHVRDVRTDRYGIRTFLAIDDVPIKVEIVSEGRISLEPSIESFFPVPALSRQDMFAEKLLANTDRGLDRSVLSRDIIDIAMMVRHWGDIPKIALDKAYDAYGDSVLKMFEGALKLIEEERYIERCLDGMSIDRSISGEIISTIKHQLAIMTRRNQAFGL